MTIKEHLKKHKTTYLVGAGCLVVGAAGAVLYMKSWNLEVADVKVAAKMINILSPRPTQNTLTLVLPERSCPSKPLIDNLSKVVYASVSEAARAAGKSRAWIIDHIGEDDLYSILEAAESQK